MYFEEIEVALKCILELVLNALDMLQSHWWVQDNHHESHQGPKNCERLHSFYEFRTLNKLFIKRVLKYTYSLFKCFSSSIFIAWLIVVIVTGVIRINIIIQSVFGIQQRGFLLLCGNRWVYAVVLIQRKVSLHLI